MASKAQRLPTTGKGTRGLVGPNYRRFVKRETARLNRRLGKLLLEDAPTKTFTHGWAD